MMAVHVSVFVIRVRKRSIPFQNFALLIAIAIAIVAMTIPKPERFLEQRVSLKRIELEFNIYVWRVII